MTVDQGLSILGIAIGVLGFVWGGSKILKRNAQSQKVSGKGNVSVQAGRDANVKVPK